MLYRPENCSTPLLNNDDGFKIDRLKTMPQIMEEFNLRPTSLTLEGSECLSY